MVLSCVYNGCLVESQTLFSLTPASSLRAFFWKVVPFLQGADLGLWLEQLSLFLVVPFTSLFWGMGTEEPNCQMFWRHLFKWKALTVVFLPTPVLCMCWFWAWSFSGHSWWESCLCNVSAAVVSSILISPPLWFYSVFLFMEFLVCWWHIFLFYNAVMVSFFKQKNFPSISMGSWEWREADVSDESEWAQMYILNWTFSFYKRE